MDADTRAALEGFPEVWRRVCGEPAAKGPANALESLRGFIADETCAAAFYEACAARFTPYSTRLKQLARDERGHLRALQTEYFLLTGERYIPPKTCPLPRGGLRALRAAYCDELSAVLAYRKAADAANDEALAGIYRKNASDEERHAGILREIIFCAL